MMGTWKTPGLETITRQELNREIFKGIITPWKDCISVVGTPMYPRWHTLLTASWTRDIKKTLNKLCKTIKCEEILF
ncbi:hypothetical protein DPEC_G00311990 [Dallia pectoralis]|uniref:Uncharacterized protein n=1 Tax=Dallia pectoralis TaxID=75939 RepID=A0ACC2FBH0_DALPE|nr:hypothetical protein DPEC_G00311990 [Dallia pectoralis]